LFSTRATSYYSNQFRSQKIRTSLGSTHCTNTPVSFHWLQHEPALVSPPHVHSSSESGGDSPPHQGENGGPHLGENGGSFPPHPDDNGADSPPHPGEYGGDSPASSSSHGSSHASSSPPHNLSLSEEDGSLSEEDGSASGSEDEPGDSGFSEIPSED
jgi:hypothetical protein